MQKCLKEIGLDVEYALVNHADRAVSGNATPGKLGGIPYFNNVNVVPSAAAGTFTEDDLNSAMQLAWSKGGKPDTVLLSGKNKRIMSGWTTNVTRYAEESKVKRQQIVNIYASDKLYKVA